MALECLDLFCGMGGWSIGFHRLGFDCTGVDVVDVGYPYRLIKTDIHQYHPDRKYDVVVMSPPCTEFSHLTKLSYLKGQRGPPEPEKGLDLVREGIRVRDEAQPKYWVMENVMGSIQYIKPILGNPMIVAKPWVLWGNIPPHLFSSIPHRGGDRKMCHTYEEKYISKKGNRIRLPEHFPFDPLLSWKRAKIPVFLSMEIAKWIKSEIENRTPGRYI